MQRKHVIRFNHHRLIKRTLYIIHHFHYFGLVIYSKAMASKAKAISARSRPNIPQVKVNKIGFEAKTKD